MATTPVSQLQLQHVNEFFDESIVQKRIQVVLDSGAVHKNAKGLKTRLDALQPAVVRRKAMSQTKVSEEEHSLVFRNVGVCLEELCHDMAG